MLELLYASGLRVSEIVSLPRDAVDMEAGILRVTGKGGKQRLVPFGKSASRWLARYLESARPGLDGKRSQKLFLSVRGASMTRQRFWQLIEGYGRKAGIRGAPDAARAAPLLRDPPARARGGPAGAPDDARALRHRDDPDLHAGLPVPPAAGLRRIPPPGGQVR